MKYKHASSIKSASNRPGAKTINVFRACLGAQLTICAQKWRNFVLFSTVSLRFVLSRVCVFLYSLGPRPVTDSPQFESANTVRFDSSMIACLSVWARNWKRWDTCLTKLKKVRHVSPHWDMSHEAETYVSPSWKGETCLTKLKKVIKH